ncbi:MAG: heme ABC transporter ATP-binding protein [Pseudomonadota bacterium]
MQTDGYALNDVRVALHGRPILDGVSVIFPAGRLTAIIGPNGAGKSSLLKVLSGDYAPQRGDVRLNDRPLADMTLLEQANRRAVMTQSTHIGFDFEVAEVLRMGFLGAPAHRESLVAEIIATCQLETLLERPFNSLSGGEQQRVHFARVVIQAAGIRVDQAPGFVLLDEPTANLDLAHELVVLRSAHALATQGFGVIVVLHDLNLAARFADELLLLANGRVVAHGEPQTVLHPDALSQCYGTPVTVEHHQALDRIVVHT